MAILLIGTLDTKGPEIAYVRDRIRALGGETIVLDSGILSEPVDIVPDITRADVALAAGSTIEALCNAGTRGGAVEKMKEGVKQVALELFAQGKLQGVLCLGGAEGAVLGATTMRALPIGVPKILVTPLASGKRTFGTFMATRDIFVLHSVIDIAHFKSTRALAGSRSRTDRAELAWRVAVPVMAAVLMVLAVPLARLRPRQGRYARIGLAVLAYFIYSNLLAAVRVWIEEGSSGGALGMWWVHLLPLGLAAWLLWREERPGPLWRRRHAGA